jgi:outer membrane protein OmpA-like peptidoglycan-associated protein
LGVGWWWLVAAALAPPFSARAQPADDVQIQVRDIVPAGQKPGMRVVVRRDIEEIKIELTRDDGEKVSLRARIGAGEGRELTWSQEPGRRTYKGEANVKYPGGATASLSLDFAVTVGGGLRIFVGRGGFSLARKEVRLNAEGRPVKVEIEIQAKDGSTLGKVERTLGEPDAQGRYVATWEARDGDEAKVIVTAYDAMGAWSRVEILPFSVFIPHKEIVFASGKWKIRDAERAKLDETLAKVREAVKQNADVEDLRLYIAGYTDTVSGKEYNRRLSRRRAREIGRYLRRKGLRIPIFYQGFGEDVLAVPTPNDTDEERNRRALYLLSNHTPEPSAQFPRSDWRRLHK